MASDFHYVEVIDMRLYAIRITFLAAAISAVPAVAQQVRFTGNTTANVTLIRDALRHVMLYSQARLQCSTIESVASEVLPKDFVPSGPPGPEGSAPAIREKWITTLCGKQFPFLVVFWPAQQGGTMFNVTTFPSQQ